MFVYLVGFNSTRYRCKPKGENCPRSFPAMLALKLRSVIGLILCCTSLSTLASFQSSKERPGLRRRIPYRREVSGSYLPPGQSVATKPNTSQHSSRPSTILPRQRTSTADNLNEQNHSDSSDFIPPMGSIFSWITAASTKGLQNALKVFDIDSLQQELGESNEVAAMQAINVVVENNLTERPTTVQTHGSPKNLIQGGDKSSNVDSSRSRSQSKSNIKDPVNNVVPGSTNDNNVSVAIEESKMDDSMAQIDVHEFSTDAGSSDVSESSDEDSTGTALTALQLKHDFASHFADDEFGSIVLVREAGIDGADSCTISTRTAVPDDPEAASVSSGFMNLMRDSLEDEYFEVQERIENDIFNTQDGHVVDEEYVLVDGKVEDISAEVQNLVRKKHFSNIATAASIGPKKNVATFVHRMQTLLVRIVKSIFFNVPPKGKGDYEPLSLPAPPSPPAPVLSDLQVIELLLSPSFGGLNGQALQSKKLKITKPGSEQQIRVSEASALPRSQTLAAAKQYLSTHYNDQYSQICCDLPRISVVFFRMNRDLQESRRSQNRRSDGMSLPARVGYILSYVLTAQTGLPEDAFHQTFMAGDTLDVLMVLRGNDDDNAEEDEFVELCQAPLRYSYTQGMDRIAAYFASKFTLRLAAPLALRFYELFMPQVLRLDNGNMFQVYARIEAEALAIVKEHLTTTEGTLTSDVATILQVLSQTRFSVTTVSTLHFSAAPSQAELDELVHFLLAELLPTGRASSANALLLAARILYSMPLFVSQLKAVLKGSKPEGFDGLIAALFVDIFTIFGPKAVFPGDEMKVLLSHARALLPIMQEGAQAN